MKVWFAIRSYGWESEEVFGPFANRRMACDFIEKEPDNNEYSEWWTDDWYVAEVSVAEKWENWNSLTHNSGKKYRPAYCTRMRRERHEQWRKDNPEQAAIEDEWVKNFRDAIKNPPKPVDILDNLQFGQEIQVKVPKNVIMKEDN